MTIQNKTQQITEIVLGIVQDGEEHSITEFRAAVLQREPRLLSAPNTLSAVLYEIQRTHPRLQRTRKGCYRYQSAEPEAQAPTLRTLTARAAVAKLRNACAEVDRSLRQPDYTMSAEEFLEYKHAHELNKKIQELLAEYRLGRP